MLARLLTFAVWGLLALCSAFWLLKLLPAPLRVPPQALPAADGTGPRADLSRLFGAPQAAPVAEVAAPVDGRYKLVGLVAPKQGGGRHAGEGVAVITVDNAPARTVRVGAAVDGDLQLLALDGNSAALGRQGVVSLRLSLAPPVPAATGSLPAAVALPPPQINSNPPPQALPVMPPAQPLPPELPPTQTGQDGNTGSNTR
ncbi:hypothetical protein [Roseateles cavernae]|uniref:hypothetical protein n=1 Tax=Roseateles cavernae TaxID=3153578 RepID=UPI0032E437E7